MGRGEGKKPSHSHSKVSEDTKSLEKPILQCLCTAAGMAGPPQGPEWTGRRLERVGRSEGFRTLSSTGVLGYCTSIGDWPQVTPWQKTTGALGVASLVGM